MRNIRRGLFKFLSQLTTGKLFTASILLMSAGMLSGGLGYLFQVLMGRMLSGDEFGVFAATMAFFAVLVTPYGALGMILSKFTTSYMAAENFVGLQIFLNKTILRACLFCLICIPLFLSTSVAIQTYLRLPSQFSVFLLITFIMLTLFITVSTSFLQGLQKFKIISINGVLAAFLKITFCAIFVFFGWGVEGAIGGAVAYSLVMVAYTFWYLVRCVARKSPSVPGARSCSDEAHNFSTLKSILPILIANSAFVVMTQLDMVLVNYFFSASESSVYATASILGKAVLYIPGGIVLALFPLVAENQVLGKTSALLLLQGLLITALLCGGVAALYFYYSPEIIQILFGDRYHDANQILKFFGIAILPMALVMVAEIFLLAQEKVLFAYLFSIIAPIEILFIYLFHNSLLTIVLIMAVTGYLTLFIGLLGIYLDNKLIFTIWKKKRHAHF